MTVVKQHEFQRWVGRGYELKFLEPAHGGKC
jgi:hypothetical protein